MTFHTGRVAVEISYPFAAMLALILTLDTRNIAAAGLMAAFFHEIGHLTWMLLCKTPIRAIHLTVSGIHIEAACGGAASYRYEAMLALAGPLGNLVAAGVLFFLPQTYETQKSMLANLAMMGINSLPIQALDGGSALEALLCMRIDRESAERVAFVVSICCLIPLTVVGFLVILQSKYNFSLMILALFLLYNMAIYSKDVNSQSKIHSRMDVDFTLKNQK